MSIYPRVKQYLELLPDGVRSYPDAVVKAGYIKHYISGVPLKQDRLPPELAAVVSRPPGDSAWVPELYFTALTLAVADERDLNEEALIRWSYERNRAMLSQPLMKLLFLVASPTMLLKGAASRMDTLHRGITLISTPLADRHWTVAMSFRPHVITPLMARCYVTAYQVAMELAGAKRPRVELVECHADNAVTRVTWDE